MPAFSRYLPTGLILLVGLGTTLAATSWVNRWEQVSRQEEVQKQINNLTTALQRTTNRYSDLMLSIGDLYAANDNQVDAQAFSRLVARAVNSYPGIQALEWAPLISAAERSVYEQQLQARTGQSVGITEYRLGALVAAGDRTTYVPVTFLEPWETNEAALGYDLASDDTRRMALETARDTGELAATGRIQLVQEKAKDQYSFLVFLPLYDQPADTPVARQQQLQGYILGVFRVADVVEAALADLDYDTDFFIVDQTAAADEQLLGFYDAAQRQVISNPQAEAQWAQTGSHAGCPTGVDCTSDLNLGQRDWQLRFLLPGQLAPPWATVATALIGGLLTTVLLVYLSRWQAELRRTRELSELKLRLFSMTSHELRTPLSVISVSAQSLGQDRAVLTPQQQHNAIARIQTAARQLGQLVEDILTLTRAEAGHLEVNPEIVELEPFCRQVVDQVQLQADQPIWLEGNALPTKAYLDKKLLHSVLANLLANAAKYSPADSPVRLIVTTTAETLEFQVIDQGIGIATDDQAQVFKAFYRGDNVGQVQGTGLGLAVVKTCVELQGGRLRLQSDAAGTAIAAVFPRVE
ncbi:CHASE domain-containing protein [Nodosilinea sp. LEGE 07088]|uniref:CHASE domain-containing sensor histidine kinase n=1 Tax=Nodosilinea sp. LEGE 07088 TaxID=2777968 RepID=UPI00187ED848|nr:CHASE domain-containing protein [Nodosilinea sp. LEGE 07088]MBE9141355.1 CHASE domain-containing protein [Nodosilinea sp. LEGE 07088]